MWHLDVSSIVPNCHMQISLPLQLDILITLPFNCFERGLLTCSISFHCAETTLPQYRCPCLLFKTLLPNSLCMLCKCAKWNNVFFCLGFNWFLFFLSVRAVTIVLWKDRGGKETISAEPDWWEPKSSKVFIVCYFNL